MASMKIYTYPRHLTLAALLIAAPVSSCVSVATSTPTPLVEFQISGSPVIKPTGPNIYIDDVYRGNPVDSRFRISLTEGDHDVRLMYFGDHALWEGVVRVTAESNDGIEVVKIHYEWEEPTE